MNCEKCQELIGDLVDGGLSRDDESTLSLHLEECLSCVDVRNDLQSIVAFCRNHRGEYSAPPNSDALWLRIRNVVSKCSYPQAARLAHRQSLWSALCRIWNSRCRNSRVRGPDSLWSSRRYPVVATLDNARAAAQ